jgi:hypothetical protein
MTRETKLRVLWEDFEHSYAWSGAFERLRERGINLTVLDYFTEEGVDHERETFLQNSDTFVIHSGTINPPDMSELITDIKKNHNNVRVLLQTEAVNELTEPFIDGVIPVHLMNELDELILKLSGK